MFAIVKVGGKQYRAEVGKDLVVDRLAAAEGDSIELTTLIVADDAGVQFSGGDSLRTVTATVVEHLKGPKLIVFKFKPKRGFKRKNGFRSSLTRLAVDKIG
jgi:large subunit ribosomal protein L21